MIKILSPFLLITILLGCSSPQPSTKALNRAIHEIPGFQAYMDNMTPEEKAERQLRVKIHVQEAYIKAGEDIITESKAKYDTTEKELSVLLNKPTYDEVKAKKMAITLIKLQEEIDLHTKLVTVNKVKLVELQQSLPQDK
ncbi:hypothetical protein P4E94_19100 [Pontiellaceae bacterium B12219]|nr:hypothetical protein [Pontiellaceae bacterium B12219]